MSFVLTLLLVFAATPFESTIDAALTAFQNNDSMTAASALDQAYISDPGTFDANNFHYLRGRIAESQNDWTRAREEFKKIASDNPLHALAAWRGNGYIAVGMKSALDSAIGFPRRSTSAS